MNHLALAVRGAVPASSATGWLVTAGLCLLAVAIGSMVGRWWVLRRRRPSEEPLPTSTKGLSTERAALVQACIRIRMLTSDPAIREIADDGLSDGGVVTVVPTGERFDPQRHHSVGEVATNDPAQDRIIARTDRPGFEDHGQRIRPADVLVLRFRTA
jgi:hypothetical protein